MSSDVSSGKSPDVSRLEAALPREMYVDRAAWAVERERVVEPDPRVW